MRGLQLGGVWVPGPNPSYASSRVVAFRSEHLHGLARKSFLVVYVHPHV
jgi:hypothetical protein